MADLSLDNPNTLLVCLLAGFVCRQLGGWDRLTFTGWGFGIAVRKAPPNGPGPPPPTSSAR